MEWCLWGALAVCVVLIGLLTSYASGLERDNEYWRRQALAAVRRCDSCLCVINELLCEIADLEGRRVIASNRDGEE